MEDDFDTNFLKTEDPVLNAINKYRNHQVSSDFTRGSSRFNTWIITLGPLFFDIFILDMFYFLEDNGFLN